MSYEFEAHSPIKTKAIPWMFCKYCGLLYLNNKITRWCVKVGCNHTEHPQYTTTVNKLIGGKREKEDN